MKKWTIRMLKKAGLTALLLFGMFFGAGNLIFPPSLGLLAGQNFLPAMLGFVISGVGIAVLTLIVGLLNPKGYYDDIAKKVSPLFALGYLALLYLAIGPFFAIPRTAAVAFNMGIAPMLPQSASSLGLFLFTALYFGLAFYISKSPSKLIDRIGKLMTPIFALMIASLVILSFFYFSDNAPQLATADYATGAAFGKGFLEGYNTLDALASVAFSLVAINAMKSFGFASKKEYLTVIWSVGLIVGLLFASFYLGLAYLGNRFPVPAEVLTSGADLGSYIISQATQTIFGSWSQVLLAIMVTMTCFTTTAGLIVSVAEFFADKFPRLSYVSYATLFSLIGFAIANLGLARIITFSVPVLQILYPVTITLVALILLNKTLPLSKIGMQLTVGAVLLVSSLSVLADSLALAKLQALLALFPLSAVGPWLTVALTGLVLSSFLPGKLKSQPLQLD